MLNMIQSERLKYKRTFAKKLVYIAPFSLYCTPLLPCLRLIQNIIISNTPYLIGGR